MSALEIISDIKMSRPPLKEPKPAKKKVMKSLKTALDRQSGLGVKSPYGAHILKRI